MRRLFGLLLVLLLFTASGIAQKIPVNEYGLAVLDSVELYLELIEENPDKELVDLEDILPDADYDIRYATENNFVGKVFYTIPKAYLRKPAADALKGVWDELSAKGIGLKIFDAYRPYAVTVAFWEPIKDSRYVANPKYGSRHNRGCAVDVALFDLETGEEYPMPTEFDDFSEKAHHGYMNLPQEVIENRELLKTTMEKYGFSPINSEWWHYDFEGWKNFELMDISFEQLETIKAETLK